MIPACAFILMCLLLFIQLVLDPPRPTYVMRIEDPSAPGGWTFLAELTGIIEPSEFNFHSVSPVTRYDGIERVKYEPNFPIDWCLLAPRDKGEEE